jgi:putative transposase
VSLAAKERQDMKGKKHSPEQIVKILREAEGAKSAREVIRRYDITDIKKLKAIQEENMRLKKLVADQALKIQLLEDVNSKKW